MNTGPLRRLMALYVGGAPGADPSLVIGNWYAVRHLDVGACSSEMSLWGVAGRFNSIHFVLEVQEDADYATTAAPPRTARDGCCCCGAMFALKALVEATSKRWSEERDANGDFLDALGRAQALTGHPPFDWDKETRR